MKKVIFLLVVSLFVYSGVFSAESLADDKNVNQEQIDNVLLKNDTEEKLIVHSDQVDRKEIKKLRKERRHLIKDRKRIMNTLNNMLLVGAAIMVFGLLLYLVVTGAPWLGIAVMVIGLVLLLYGVLKKFF